MLICLKDKESILRLDLRWIRWRAAVCSEKINVRRSDNLREQHCTESRSPPKPCCRDVANSHPRELSQVTPHFFSVGLDLIHFLGSPHSYLLQNARLYHPVEDRSVNSHSALKFIDSIYQDFCRHARFSKPRAAAQIIRQPSLMYTGLAYKGGKRGSLSYGLTSKLDSRTWGNCFIGTRIPFP